MCSHPTPKQRAAAAALDYLFSNSVIGLGSGSTAECFLIALADELRSGRLRNVTGVPTSESTARKAAELGIPLTTLSNSPRLAVDVDGADEVSPKLELIKGGGGALLREKMIAQHSDRMIVIADSKKRVTKLGVAFPLPVEVVQFEHEATGKFLESLGCTVKLRRKTDGSPYVSDNGSLIYDCHFPGGIDDPPSLDAKLHARAGIIETGLFLGLAKVALIADETHVDTIP